jgi:hypothetical protein
MPQVDPVILQLRADVDDYQRRLTGAQRHTDEKLDAIERRGSKMSAGLSHGFSLAKTAAVSFAASLGTDAIIGAINRGLEYASSLGEVAQQLGVTTDALQEYRYAASQAGLSSEEMDQALSQLTRRIGEAQSGTKAQAEAFAKLGVNVKGLTAGNAIPAIADAMQKIQSPAERAAILMDLFGRSGQKLEPLLAGGAKGVNELREAAHKLGIVLSEKQIQQADETADKLSAVKQVLEAKLAGTVADNADAILELADRLERLASAAIKAFQALDRFSQTKVGQALAQVGRLGSEPLVALGRLGGAAVDYVNGTGGGRPAAAPRGSANISQMWKNARPAGLPRANFAGGGIAGIGGSPLDGYAPGGITGGLAAISGGPSGAASIGGSIVENASDLGKSIGAFGIMLDRLNADLAAATADLTGSIQDRADAENKRIDVELAEAKMRIREDAELDDVKRQLLLNALDLKASTDRQLVAQRLAEGIDRQTADAKQDAARRREEAYRQLGPLGRYSADLREGRSNTGERIEALVVEELDHVQRGINNAITKHLGIDDPLISGLLDILLEDILFRPIADILSQKSGGGGILGSILGGIFGGGSSKAALKGRASGGPVSRGTPYMVGESGREIFVPDRSGMIIPAGQVNAMASQGGQGGGVATVRLELSGDLDARIQSVSAGVAVEVVRSAAPQIVDASARETMARANRPRI